MKCNLSIMIPTYNRKKCFNSLLYKCILKILDEYESIECIVACSSKEYLPNINHNRIKVFDTSGYSREENYIFGIEQCSGNYVLIAEDDDIVSIEAIRNFMLIKDYNSEAKVFLYNGYLPNTFKDKIFSKEISDGYYESNTNIIFRLCENKFQWGQCITERNTLLKNMKYFWKDNKNIVRSDEIITILCIKNSKYVYISNKILLITRIFNDNYSWNNSLETEQDNIYIKLLKTYLNI